MCVYRVASGTGLFAAEGNFGEMALKTGHFNTVKKRVLRLRRSYKDMGVRRRSGEMGRMQLSATVQM